MDWIRRYPLIFSALFLFLVSVHMGACRAYKWTPVGAEDVLAELTDLNTYLVYKEKGSVSTHPKNMWKIDIFKADTSKISGEIRRLKKAEIRDALKIKGSPDAIMGEHRTMLFINEAYGQHLPDTGKIEIPYSAINRMVLYEYDKKKAIAMTAGSLVLIGLVAFVGIVLISVSTKTSCPFIYSDTPDGPVFEGEVYSGATTSSLERHDWLPMNHLQPVEDTCRVLISNEVREIQHTNLLELVAIDHPEGTKALFDSDGKLHTIQELRPPKAAFDLSGTEVASAVLKKDSLWFLGDFKHDHLDAKEVLELSFDRPAGAQTGKLFLHAKNSSWLDVSYGLFLDELGVYVKRMNKENEKKSKAEIEQWMLDQHIPLSVELETAQGEWQNVGWFQLPGPVAARDMVMPIDLSAASGNEIRIRLTTGFMFWEIDQVGVDFSENAQVQTASIPVASALDQNGVDHSAELRRDDDAYYHQPFVGDMATVLFPVGDAPDEGMERSYLLHAKGYYEILRDVPNHRPSRKRVNHFRQPESFTLFAKEKWDVVKKEGITFSN